MNTFRGSPLLIAAHAGFASDPARLTRETLSFPILSTSNRKNRKNLRFFSFFRFEVLKIDREAHPAWLTRETISFPILSMSNRKNEKNLRFFNFSNLTCSKSIEGLNRLWQIRVKSCRIRVNNPNFSEGLGIDLGVSESLQFTQFEQFRAIFDDFGKILQISRLHLGIFVEIVENCSKWLEHIAKRLFRAS